MTVLFRNKHIFSLSLGESFATRRILFWKYDHRATVTRYGTHFTVELFSTLIKLARKFSLGLRKFFHVTYARSCRRASQCWIFNNCPGWIWADLYDVQHSIYLNALIILPNQDKIVVSFLFPGFFFTRVLVPYAGSDYTWIIPFSRM